MKLEVGKRKLNVKIWEIEKKNIEKREKTKGSENAPPSRMEETENNKHKTKINQLTNPELKHPNTKIPF